MDMWMNIPSKGLTDWAVPKPRNSNGIDINRAPTEEELNHCIILIMMRVLRLTAIHHDSEDYDDPDEVDYWKTTTTVVDFNSR